MDIANNVKYNINTPTFSGVNLKQIPKIITEVASKSETKAIMGQENCWRLYKPEVLEEFIKSDKELAEILSETLEVARVYGLKPSIDLFHNMRKSRPDIQKFYEIVKSKYNIDLEIPPKVYRFVGASEIKALERDGVVKPQRGYWEKFDVTLNPDLNWNDYRVTFKPRKEFSVLDKTSRIKENRGTGHDYFYHYEGPYTMDDVEIIEQYRCLK